MDETLTKIDISNPLVNVWIWNVNGMNANTYQVLVMETVIFSLFFLFSWLKYLKSNNHPFLFTEKCCYRLRVGI